MGLSESIRETTIKHPPDFSSFFYDSQPENVSLKAQVDRFYQNHFPADHARVGTEEWSQELGQWNASNRRTVLVVGAGQAGVQAANYLKSRGHHVAVVEKTRGEKPFGGMSVLAISSLIHDDLRGKSLRTVAQRVTRVGIDLIPGKSIRPKDVKRWAKQKGFDLILWAAGTDWKPLKEANYALPGVVGTEPFVVAINEAVDRHDDLLAVAEHFGIRFADDEGRLLPFILPSGGKATEDIVIALRVMQVLYAVKNKWGSMDTSVLDPRKIARAFEKEGYQSALGRFGLVREDLGLIVPMYHGRRRQSAVETVPGYLIEPILKEYEAKKESITREKASRIARKSPKFEASVQKVLDAWKFKYGVEFLERSSLLGTRMSDTQLWATIEEQHPDNDGQSYPHVWGFPVGGVIPSVGFYEVDPKIFAGDGPEVIIIGIGLSGEGAIGPSVANATAAAKQADEYLQALLIADDKEEGQKRFKNVRRKIGRVQRYYGLKKPVDSVEVVLSSAPPHLAARAAVKDSELK